MPQKTTTESSNDHAKKNTVEREVVASVEQSTDTPESKGNLGSVPRDEDSERLNINRPQVSVPEPEAFEDLPQTERTPLKLYLQEIGKTPLLKPEEEVDLARRIHKGDEKARQKMIQSNLRLVVKIAHDYANFGLPLLDLISEGNIGLIKAVERFDPDKGGKLSTYAAWWIKQSIKRALANQSKTIRLPVHLVDKIAKMRRMTTALREELEREPTDEEIGYAMEMPTNKVAHLKSVSVRPASLDAPVGDGEDTEFGQLVGDENAISPFESLKSKSLMTDISEMLEELEEREADIIRLRFGLGGERPQTLEEVGQHFDVTRERVRQLQNMALQKMRRSMAVRERQRTAEEVHEENIERSKMEVLKEFFKGQDS
ncbi:sigma-70 family RNA polymerase sigma factor [Rubellicoccus peritrichatus]|uniref:RNA polymerase sigma factor n=1 Tax=Rubellicoccus peritrichatus TaxID=3080537 RepID=A0AAQ3LCL3_9BACT|nr:sigma-70 family RNA polymerase sigma factor [Puniceicoccus sp. CR14]WOO41992.1 sigma-70 family RNA polymerase sigma factor [Puniceicoccus sp. CR14]